MAKKSKVAKYERQKALVEKYAEIRRMLKAEGRLDELRKLPKDSSPTRLHNRCDLTGRPHGYMRKFGMSRIRFRELAHQGQLPGVKKASW